MHFFRTDSRFEDDSAAIDTAQCAVYLMTGEYDYSCTPEAMRETAKEIAGAQAIVMTGLGHFPMSEHPERFRDYILPVLQAIRAG
jgi:pimeloyl-ACP methyl ester carboxylesterase